MIATPHFEPFSLEIPQASELAIVPREPLPPLVAPLDDTSAGQADDLCHAPRLSKIRKLPPKPFPCPFVIAIDHRERSAAYPFAGLDAGHHHSYRPVVVEKVMKHLPTGDYSIVGCESEVVAERKQLSDFLSTISQRLEQFRAEHERMAAIIAAGGRACVIIESSWEEVYRLRGHFTRMTWQAIRGVYEEWQVRYGVPWRMEGGRRMAERATWEFLWRWWWGRERDRERDGENDMEENREGKQRVIEEACEGL